MGNNLKILSKLIRFIKSNQGIIWNISWSVADKVFRAFVMLITWIQLANYLDPQEFGLFSYAHTFVTLFGVLASLGMDVNIVKFLIDNHKEKYGVLLLALMLKIFVALLTIGLVIIIAIIAHDRTQVSDLIALFSLLILFQALNIFEFYFQSQEQIKFASIASIIGLSIGLIAKMFFIYFDYGIWPIVLTFTLEFLCIGIINIWFFYRLKNTLSISMMRLEWMSPLLKKSWPLLFSAISITLYMKIDQIMLLHIAGEYEVGIYAAALKLSEGWNFISIAISTAVFPLMIRYSQNHTQLDILTTKFFTLVIFIALFIALVFTFYSEQIISLLYKNEYQDAAIVLQILIWSLVFSFYGTMRSKWIIIHNLQIFSLYYVLLGITVNIILNYMLIPLFDSIGAAISTLLSQIFVALIFPLLFRKTRKTVSMFFKSMLFWRVLIFKKT